MSGKSDSNSRTFNGLPYRGKPLDIKNEDIEERLPVLQHEGHAGVFNMSLTEDIEKYNDLMANKVNGTIIIGQQRIVYDRDLHTFVIFMEWADRYYVSPPEH